MEGVIRIERLLSPVWIRRRETRRRPRARCSRAYAHLNQCPDSHEVVRGIREGEDPTHFRSPAMTQFPQATDRLAPSEAFFDQLPFDLTDVVARVASGSVIHGALGP